MAQHDVRRTLGVMLQGQEIIVILLVALVVLGPQRLPDLARRAGRWTAELRNAARELRAGLEAEVGDLREIQQEFKAPMRDVTDAMADVKKEAGQVKKDADEAVDTTEVTKPVSWVGPVPDTGPTPDDAASDLAEIERTGGPVTDEPDEAAG